MTHMIVIGLVLFLFLSVIVGYSNWAAQARRAEWLKWQAADKRAKEAQLREMTENHERALKAEQNYQFRHTHRSPADTP